MCWCAVKNLLTHSRLIWAVPIPNLTVTIAYSLFVFVVSFFIFNTVDHELCDKLTIIHLVLLFVCLSECIHNNSIAFSLVTVAVAAVIFQIHWLMSQGMSFYVLYHRVHYTCLNWLDLTQCRWTREEEWGKKDCNSVRYVDKCRCRRQQTAYRLYTIQYIYIEYTVELQIHNQFYLSHTHISCTTQYNTIHNV